MSKIDMPQAIREYRYVNDLTQSQLAVLINVSRPTIANYESGAMIPSKKNEHKLMKLIEESKARQSEVVNHESDMELPEELATKLEINLTQKEVVMISWLIHKYMPSEADTGKKILDAYIHSTTNSNK